MRSYGFALKIAPFCAAFAFMAACAPQGSSPGSVDGNYAPVINPANFVQTVDNPYLPLTPGTVYVYEGKTEEGLEHTEVTVTFQTKVVMGVTCIVVRDVVQLDGVVVEDTLDFYAQDKDGNVWYFGEDVSNFENGNMVSKEGSWTGGVDGAQPGIIMWAHPAVGQKYRQEYYAGKAEDMAEVISVTESVSVFYGSYADVLKTNDYTPLEPDVAEEKYYAAGVGLVLEVVAKGGTGRIELIEIRTEK